MVAFTDGDCIVSKDWVDQFIEGVGAKQYAFPAEGAAFAR